jgi:hypothetical protein
LNEAAARQWLWVFTNSGVIRMEELLV